MNKKYRVTLTEDERSMLQQLITSGTAAVRTVTHARILLKADQSDAGPGWTDDAIRHALDVSVGTIARVRERFVEESLEAALTRRRPQRVRTQKLDGEQEAHLIALACSAPPDGQKRWSLRLLADRMVQSTYVDTVSHETIRQVLKKTSSSHG